MAHIKTEPPATGTFAPSTGQADSAPARLSGWQLLGWAAFLACSWTWVIGMVLPALLVRDHGLAGWLALAVPNVIGAAAVGFCWNRKTSWAFVTRHADLMRVFAVVTVAFQLYVAAWLLPRLVGMAGVVAAPIIVGLVVIPAGLRLAGGRAAGLATLLASVACAVAFLLTAEVPTPVVLDGPVLGLLGLAAVCAVGFGFCPQLDLTFHYACQSIARDRDRRAAFVFGFGVLFLAMILFTLLYGSALLSAGELSRNVAVVLAIHLTVQLAFTARMQGQALRHTTGRLVAEAALAPPAAARTFHRWNLALLAGTQVGFTLGLLALAFDFNVFAGLSFGEIGYRLFLGFYGLVFPAMLAVSLARGRFDRQAVATAAITIVVALPFFAYAFVWRDMAWSLAGVVVLAAGVGVARVRR
ncbi:MAG: hypothetical protein ACFCVE_11280 [Phycisphaerae bacterium]